MKLIFGHRKRLVFMLNLYRRRNKKTKKGALSHVQPK